MKYFEHPLPVLFMLLSGISVSGCNLTQQDTLFTRLSPEQTGITFRNDISENRDAFFPGDAAPSATNEFLYMGGGVGVGDFNNDGLKDLFFAGNQVSSRLYLNLGPNQEGNVHFKDITQRAGTETGGWATGVSIADINNNGFDDIYVSVYGGKNLLFINNGDLTFTEQAEVYGLAYEGDSTQALLFDYDKDGKTDLFLLNLWLDGPNPNTIRPPDLSGQSPANDRLFKNIGVPDGKDHPVFVDVTEDAGIAGNGYGLGIVASDLNGNGWPDLYVANDFLYGDELWLNNKDGTFTNVIGEALRQQSYSSMGAEAADLTNNFLVDIISLDMSPEENERKKMQYTFMNYERFQRERETGYEPFYMRNMLQLNIGTRRVGEREIPLFSETGRYAGISETDWSWSVLAADFTNNTRKDLFITNGSGRDYLNADFIEYSLSDDVRSARQSERDSLLNERMRSLGFITLPNYLYLNNGDYTFTRVFESPGMDAPLFATGAVYADIDNDGDLDLITNNINEPASVFVNNTRHRHPNNHENTRYLQVELTGPEANPDAFGTKVLVYAGENRQKQEKYPVRGYLSSVDSRLFFGMGNAQRVDSLFVIWPDEQIHRFRHLPTDTLLTISYDDIHTDTARIPEPSETGKPPVFREITGKNGITYKHTDTPYNDFTWQPLLLQQYSRLGPFITTADVDNNGLTDFFIGGGFNSPGAMFRQQEPGVFESVRFDTTLKYQEDMDAVFFDSNGNGYPDLLVTYGDTRYDSNSIYYKPRLYLNDGEGNFRHFPDAIPDHVRTIAGAVAVEDINGNGQPDVFIGGRVSKAYPLAPRSYLLKNENGIFKDITEETAPELVNPGMITDAVWTDFDHDGVPDLVLSGEWMPVRFFKNHTHRLTEITGQTGLSEMNGFWRSLAACDVNRDGNIDIIAGNSGANNRYRISTQTPMKLFAADVNEDGLTDPVPFYYRTDRSGSRNLYPAVLRDRLLEQVPAYERLFPTNRDYSTAGVEDLFGHLDRDDLLEWTVEEPETLYLENRGDGTFVKHSLPPEVQFAPVDAILCDDFDGDGNIDLLMAGNEYQTHARTGRYDASYGLFLKGEGSNRFRVIPPSQSGFIVIGDVKDMALLKHPSSPDLVLVAVNDDSLRVFKTGLIP